MTNVQDFLDRAMIVHCHIRQWGSSKLDKEATAEINRIHGASPDAARVSKKLVQADELTAITNVHQRIRLAHYTYTSPWLDRGGRIIAAKLYLDYIKAMRELKDEAEACYAKFVPIYPDLIDRARGMLGSLWKRLDYPSPDRIRARFGVEITFAPLPQVDDFRINLAADDIKEIKDELESRLGDHYNRVAADIYERLLEVIKKMQTSLADPDKIFRDSLVYNVLELTEFLPKLNFGDNPEVDAMIKRVQSELCSTLPDTLRENSQVRQLVADEAEDLMADLQAKMSGYM